MPDPSGALTEEQFAADVAAGRARAAPPPLNIASPPPTAFQQQEMAYSPPPVVDRMAFLNDLKQRWTQAEEQRVQQEQARQRYLQGLSFAQGLANEMTGGGYGALTRATNLATRMAAPGAKIKVLDPKYYGFANEDEARIAAETEDPTSERGRRAVAWMNANYGGSPQDALDAAQTYIPGSHAVQNVVGQIAGAVAPQFVRQVAPGAALIGDVANLIPGVNSQAVESKAAQVGAESLVPTQVWQAALTLLPAAKARTIPELLSAITLGDTDALTALRNAGKQLGESPKVESLIAKLSSESGMAKIPGEPEDLAKFAARLTPEQEQAAITAQMENRLGGLKNLGPNAKAITSLKEQRALITKAIRTLTPKEADQLVVGDVGTAMRVAARYDRNAPERQTLIDAVMPKVAHLPEAEQKFIRVAIEVATPNKEAQAAIEALRARQAAGSATAWRSTEGTVPEKAAAAFKAMGGKSPQRFTPIGTHFTDADSAALYSRIEDAVAAKRISQQYEAPNATSALMLLLTGHRLESVAYESQKPLNLMPSEIKLLGRVFGPEFEASIPKNAVQMNGWLNGAIDVLNLPRALVTAADISAAGRQGIILAPRNFIEAAKAFPEMIKAMASEGGFQRSAQRLRENSHFEDALAHGLELTDVGGGAAAEEQFFSRLASKLPVVRGSERGFVMYLDTLRMLTYEKNANRWERLAAKKGWGPEQLNLVKNETARFINHASGRGELGAFGNLTPAMNAAFFAPRFLVSRPQTVWDMVRPGATKQSRQLAFENLGAFVGSGMAMLQVAKQFGADVELDPRSSDFGKMKFGNTRVEFWGGFQPLARYIAQTATASTKPLAGGKPQYAYPGDTIARFIRSKLSPAGALLYDYIYAKGKGYSGEDLLISPKDIGWNETTRTFAKNSFLDKITPLGIQDAIDGYRQAGWGAAFSSFAVSALGGGVGSFAPSEQSQKTANKSIALDKLNSVGYQDIVPDTWKDNLPKLSAAIPGAEKFDNIEELKKDYLAPTPGGIVPTRAQIDRRAAQFEAIPAVKAYRAMIKSRETYILKKADPADVQAAYDSGAIDLDADQRKALGIR